MLILNHQHPNLNVEAVLAGSGLDFKIFGMFIWSWWVDFGQFCSPTKIVGAGENGCIFLLVHQLFIYYNRLRSSL